MIRPQFVALGGFALIVACSAGLGIASAVESDLPPIPEDMLCDPASGKDWSKLRVDVAGPDGEVLRDKHGKPFTVPMCPKPPPYRSGSVPEHHDSNCRVERNWRGVPGVACEDDDCGFDVDKQGALVEVCDEPTGRGRNIDRHRSRLVDPDGTQDDAN